MLLEGWALLLSRSPSLAQALEYRHKLIDAAVARHDLDVLVEIPGGFSRRAVTWVADHGVRAVEIDLPHVIAAKSARIAAAGLEEQLGGRHSLVAANALGDGFADELKQLIGEARRPVVVVEGLLVYFPPADRDRFLASVASALQGTDGLVLADVYTSARRNRRAFGAKLLKFGIRLATRGQGWQSSWPDDAAVEASWRQAGFTQLGTVAAGDFPDLALPFDESRAPGVVLNASCSRTDGGVVADVATSSQVSS
ncbi:MAG: hypothetical protein GY898_30050 [Proteobacteria bacterium]|nr:hypothetical protein [Pseudomonadota bacterium]